MGVVMVVLLSAWQGRSVCADSVQMTFDGIGLNVGGSFRIHHWDYNSNSMRRKTVLAGQMNWTIDSVSGNVPNLTAGQSVVMFCIDVFDYVRPQGESGSYDYMSVADAPQSPPNGPPAPYMGEAKAALVSHFYSKFYDDSSASGTYASAFQLALWELINENLAYAEVHGFSLTKDTSDTGPLNDTFFVTSGDGTTRATANLWLSEVYSDWQAAGFDTGGLNGFGLGALTDPEAQDMVFIVPPPPAVLLIAAGIPIVMVLRRQRQFTGV